jgi:regulator of sigma E protease
LAFAFVLGVLVFVHELGHFLAAKRVGIKVLKFQLGFNPTIARFRKGDTEYSIGALPLGGYVKMAGESADESRTGRPDEFLSKTKWQRFQVLIMGPVMNLLLAVILLAIVLYRGAEVPVFDDQPVVVGAVERDSPGARAGIRPGDRIVSVADRGVEDWQDFYIAVGTRANRDVSVGFVRNGATHSVRVTPVPVDDSRFEIGDIGVLPDVHPWLRFVSPDDAGARDGLKAGDVILAVNGERIVFQTQLRRLIAAHPEKPMVLTIRRDGAQQDITVTPGRRGETGYLGVTPADEMRTLKPGPLQAIGMSLQRNAEMTGMILTTIWDLLRRETSPKQLMGPVAIAQLSGESAQMGWVALVTLMASISLNLGLLNLLPIPVLDGGHIAIMALEGVARRDFSIRVKEKMLIAGFVALVMLMVTALYNDLMRISWIEGIVPWR